MLDLTAIIGASGELRDLLEQCFVVLRQAPRLYGRALCEYVLSQGVKRQPLELETERVNLTGVRGVFPTETQRAAYQVQQILNGDKVPHLLPCDLQQEILQYLELFLIRIIIFDAH